MVGAGVFLVQQLDIVALPLHERNGARLLSGLRIPLSESGGARHARDHDRVGRRRVRAERKLAGVIAAHCKCVSARGRRHDVTGHPRAVAIGPILRQALEGSVELTPAGFVRIIRVGRERTDRVARNAQPMLH